MRWDYVQWEEVHGGEGAYSHTENDTPSLTNTDTETAAPTAFTSLDLQIK